MELVNRVHQKQPFTALVNSDAWHPTADEFHAALQLIPNEQYRAKVLRFHKGFRSAAECRHHEMTDPKTFVTGRLLHQIAFGALAGHLKGFHGIDPAACVLETEEGRLHVGHLHTWFNANVSHAAGVVAIAATEIPGCVVGCDVMPVELAPPEPIGASSVANFFDLFQDYFTTAEWRWIQAPVNISHARDRVPRCAQGSLVSSDAESIEAFFHVKRFMTVWALKESIIKAMGIGLGFELQRASFSFTRADCWDADFYSPRTHVSLHLDGTEALDWQFWLYERHEWNSVAATALGPVAAAKESSFHATFTGALQLDQRPNDATETRDEVSQLALLDSALSLTVNDVLAVFEL
jgi:phosphopantetheinyl transferase (holo-ACP synthase)